MRHEIPIGGAFLQIVFREILLTPLSNIQHQLIRAENTYIFLGSRHSPDSPIKSYMKTAIAEVAEGIANNKNNRFCQVPRIRDFQHFQQHLTLGYQVPRCV